jgi:hypothetical protein
VPNDYNWYKSLGICPMCRKKRPAGGHVICLECMSDASEKNRRRRERLTPEQRHAESLRAVEYKRQRKERRKAEGLCVECGKHPPKEGRIRCGICLHKHSERMKLYHRSKGCKPRELLLAHDVCYICGGEPLPGKRVCAEHMAMCVNNLSNAYYDNTNHIWRRLKYGKNPND